MKTTEKRDIERLFHNHKEFSECIIEELALKDYGTTLDVVFNYIWTDSGELRPDLNEPNDIILRFQLVQELQICNGTAPWSIPAPRRRLTPCWLTLRYPQPAARSITSCSRATSAAAPQRCNGSSRITSAPHA